MYIVNFDNNEGYAILAADERISSKVISIVDEGSIQIDDFQVQYSDIQTEDGLENFSLYNAQENDYYVGISAPVDQRAMTTEMMYEYAIDEIDNYAGGSSSYSTSVITDPWVVTQKVYPMLTTLWHQSSPFNDNSPLRGWFNNKVNAPAGCVPIAVAQIMAYSEYANTSVFGGIVCNWGKMKSNYSLTNYGKGSIEAQNQVACFVRDIGTHCETIYSKSFGFALPRNARDCMRYYGYSNAERYYGYSETKAKTMISSGKPFFSGCNFWISEWTCMGCGWFNSEGAEN